MRKLAFGTIAALAIACDASGTVSGGEPLFDAATPPASTSTVEGDAGPNPTWAGIYADFFAPTGKGSCAGDGTCHGAANEPGAVASNFVCGADKNACFESMTGASGLVDATNPAPPSGLESIIRKASGGGRMPLRSTVSFSIDDVARIRAWIKNGAKNDG